jgi:hypothetical protein
MYSDNRTVQAIVACACRDARTDLGANVAWLRDKYNLIVPVDFADARRVICAAAALGEEQECIAQVCREMVDVCAGGQDNGLSPLENSALLATLCIN